jgi:hypothetical protein
LVTGFLPPFTYLLESLRTIFGLLPWTVVVAAEESVVSTRGPFLSKSLINY